MKNILLFLVMIITLFSCQSKEITNSRSETIKIAFGSCGHQNKPQPMLDIAAGLQPDIFIYLGDNIYGDSENMEVLRKKYAKLAAKSEFQNLRKQTTVLATWDDHDFGANDAGRHYQFKEESKAIFMDFWNVPADSDRRKHEGIYGVEYLKKQGLTVQIILLDTRTFRDKLIPRTKGDIRFKNDYAFTESADSTFLGSEQWQWLEVQLKQKSDVRIIASSNQFGHEYNGWESWTNVPHEQQKMLDLIKKTEANGVVFISGDVHWGEISKMENDKTYPIYDVTSSGITQTWYNIEPNKNRVGTALAQNNIGLIEITKQQTTQLKLSLFDATNQAITEQIVNLKAISF
jgi:alkaline phosphatase D